MTASDTEAPFLRHVTIQQPSDLTLPALLTLARLDDNTFVNTASLKRHDGVLTGNQVLAQALMAAMHTVAARPPHSVHGYFLRKGAADRPIVFDVERSRDGGNYSTRRVVARQGGKAVLHLSASFQTPERGIEHQLAWRSVPPAPETVDSFSVIAQRLGDRLPPLVRSLMTQDPTIEIRPVEPDRLLSGAPSPAPLQVWLRTTQSHDDAAYQYAALAYLSCCQITGTGLIRHGRPLYDPATFGASLDHALWLYGTADPGDWILYEITSPWAAQGRALSRGTLYRRDGSLIAAAAQEAVYRPRRA